MLEEAIWVSLKKRESGLARLIPRDRKTKTDRQTNGPWQDDPTAPAGVAQWTEHQPANRARSPVGGVREATTH